MFADSCSGKHPDQSCYRDRLQTGQWPLLGILSRQVVVYPVDPSPSPAGEGREHLKKNQSYVFVANHQGAFDIFLIYGFLGRNFKWMMKKGIRKIPLVGLACEYAHHIFIDKSGPSKIRASYDRAREVLKEGMSLVVFPEGARSFTGHMGVFRRGAFMLADELQLPVCPLTINGSFDVKPRMKDIYWAFWHPLKLTIHEPIEPMGKGPENIKNQMTKSYDAIMSGLVKEYQGFVENPDQ